MPDLAIIKFPDSRLKNKAAFVTRVTDLERSILHEMARLMYIYKGIGLAATQVGIDKRIIVIDAGQGLINIINPVLLQKEGRDVMEEGCLSVPNACVKIERAHNVTIEYLNENGEALKITDGGLLARVIQHEMDHLNGKIILDYLSPIEKLFVKIKTCGRLTKSL